MHRHPVERAKNATALQLRLRRAGKALLRSDRFQALAARCLHAMLRFVRRSNRPVAASKDLRAATAGRRPVNIALWRDQQMLVPSALATSRSHVVERAWDRMTVNLPFGRRCVRYGEPIYVPADASEDTLAESAGKVTGELNRVTEQARRLVEARQ